MRDQFTIESLCNLVEHQHRLPNGDWSDIAIRQYTDIEDGVRELRPSENLGELHDIFVEAMKYRYDLAKKLKNKRLSTVLRVLLMNDKDIDMEILNMVIKYIK